mgnify:CR=1 FL=1
MKIKLILLSIFLFVSSINLTPTNNVVVAQNNTPNAPLVIEAFKADVIDSSVNVDCQSMSFQACLEEKISKGFISLDMEITYHNVSNKIINAVSWEVKTSEENKKPILLEFKTNKRVDPNKRKIITLNSSYQSHFPQSGDWAIRLTKVEFTDKTFWENTFEGEPNLLLISFAPDFNKILFRGRKPGPVPGISLPEENTRKQ